MTERRSTCRNQMGATNVQINDLTRLIEHFVNLLFVLAPSLLISLQLLVLVLALLGKLGFLSTHYLAFTLELVTLRPEEVLKAEHKLFQ